MRAGALALALTAGCGGDGARLAVDLVLPDRPAPSDVVELRIEADWNGGRSTATVPFADGGSLSLALPEGPVDVTVTGLEASGQATWRGIARGVEVPAAGQGSARAKLLFGAIGAFSLFGDTGVMPALAGSAAVPWGVGQVLISGGRSSSGELSNGLWLFGQGSLRTFGPQSLEPRAHHLAAAVSDASGAPLLFLAGGDQANLEAADTAEVVTGSGPVVLHPLGGAQRFPAAAVAPDGLQLLVGCGEGGPAAVDLYQPAAALLGFDGGWEGALPLPATCERGQITWLPALAGAVAGDGSDGSLTLLTLSGPPQPWGAGAVRHGFGALALSDGGLLQFGGDGDGDGGPLSSFVAFGAGSAPSGFAEARADFGWTVTPGGALLAVGGRGPGGGPLASAELVPTDGTAALEPLLNRARIRPAVADISGCGAALVVSGEDADGGPVGGLEMFTYP
ncbi:MAG: hypothetical protein ACYDCL_15790 [Myxococcales bacterium]